MMGKIKALNEKRCAEISQYYTDNAIVSDPRSSTVVSKDQIEANCVGFHEIFDQTYFDIKTLLTSPGSNEGVVEWLWIGVTKEGCLFHLRGFTHFEMDENIFIQKESDFYSVQEMREKMFCKKESVSRPLISDSKFRKQKKTKFILYNNNNDTMATDSRTSCSGATTSLGRRCPYQKIGSPSSQRKRRRNNKQRSSVIIKKY